MVSLFLRRKGGRRGEGGKGTEGVLVCSGRRRQGGTYMLTGVGPILSRRVLVFFVAAVRIRRFLLY
jgi:hypothetical protein